MPRLRNDTLLKLRSQDHPPRTVPIPLMPQERGGRVESSLLTDSGATNVGKKDREGFARDGYKGPGKTPNGPTSLFWGRVNL